MLSQSTARQFPRVGSTPSADRQPRAQFRDLRSCDPTATVVPAQNRVGHPRNVSRQRGVNLLDASAICVAATKSWKPRPPSVISRPSAVEPEHVRSEPDQPCRVLVLRHDRRNHFLHRKHGQALAPERTQHRPIVSRRHRRASSRRACAQIASDRCDRPHAALAARYTRTRWSSPPRRTRSLTPRTAGPSRRGAAGADAPGPTSSRRAMARSRRPPARPARHHRCRRRRDVPRQPAAQPDCVRAARYRHRHRAPRARRQRRRDRRRLRRLRRRRRHVGGAALARRSRRSAPRRCRTCPTASARATA